ncbi:hypothetical protein EF908_13005 [Streptomyces sp. WAC04770]|nr:hypothetical protein EF908_13005 [Streptomyces sp. WAC04770]
MSLSRSAGTEHAVAPGGCRWCGIEARAHARQWTAEAGWHAWTAPTTEQRKERMLQRRTQQQVSRRGPAPR